VGRIKNQYFYFLKILYLYIFEQPIMFKQHRVGKDKKPFEILKFQTMFYKIPTKTELDELS
jgi:lipopolysaccharide/colanic/teichoic acid biosynthesis glycosyltransferase